MTQLAILGGLCVALGASAQAASPGVRSARIHCALVLSSAAPDGVPTELTIVHTDGAPVATQLQGVGPLLSQTAPATSVSRASDGTRTYVYEITYTRPTEVRFQGHAVATDRLRLILNLSSPGNSRADFNEDAIIQRDATIDLIDDNVMLAHRLREQTGIEAHCEIQAQP